MCARMEKSLLFDMLGREQSQNGFFLPEKTYISFCVRNMFLVIPSYQTNMSEHHLISLVFSNFKGSVHCFLKIIFEAPGQIYLQYYLKMA